MVDEMFAEEVKERIGETQQIPKDDEEEQKELDLKKQYNLFTREAEELRNKLEEALDEAGREDGKIEETLQLYKIRKEEMSQRFQKLGETATEAL